MPEPTAQLYPGPPFAGAPHRGEPWPGPLYAVAQDALTKSGVYPLRELTVEPHNEGLLITGAVSSFYLKQLAQEVVLAAAGAIELVNSVRVMDDNDREDEST